MKYEDPRKLKPLSHRSETSAAASDSKSNDNDFSHPGASLMEKGQTCHGYAE